jgi:hypothetical protein
MSDETVKLDDPLASVIYDLISQHIPPGVFEEVIDRVEIMEEGKEISVEYHLGHIAMHIADRLRELNIYQDKEECSDSAAAEALKDRNKENLS